MRYEDPDVSVIALIGICGAIFLFVLTVAIQAFFYSAERAEHVRKVVDQPNEELAQIEAQHIEQLNGYRWVAQDAGTVAIPIDRAMALVVEESASADGR